MNFCNFLNGYEVSLNSCFVFLYEDNFSKIRFSCLIATFENFKAKCAKNYSKGKMFFFMYVSDVNFTSILLPSIFSKKIKIIAPYFTNYAFIIITNKCAHHVLLHGIVLFVWQFYRSSCLFRQEMWSGSAPLSCSLRILSAP